MQLLSKNALKAPKMEVLQFVDEYLPNTPIEEINAALIITTLCKILDVTPFTSSICYLLPVGMQLEMDSKLVEQYLTKAKQMANSHVELKQVQQLAEDYNHLIIYGNKPEQIKQDFTQAICNHWHRLHWSNKSKPTPQTAHQPL